MAEGILMPKQGITVESCIITKWYKKVGDSVKLGDAIFGYETDKSTFDCESTAEGEILAIFFEEGEEVPVLTNVCAVGQPGEDFSALKPQGEASPEAAGAASGAPSAPAPAGAGDAAPTSAPAAPASSVSAPAVSADGSETGRLRISPRARALADRLRLPAELAQGTGPYGRILERDIRALAQQGVGATPAAAGQAAGRTDGTAIGGRVGVADSIAAPAPEADSGAEYEDVKFSGIRRTIARSMVASLSEMAQLTMTASFDAGELLAYRAQLKASAEELGLPKITVNDLLLFAVSRTLPSFADLNAHLLEDNVLRRFRAVHLGFAVDTPRGLMVPTIRNADKKSLAEIARESKELARSAQEGNISPDLLGGATFTVSNLGAMGIESFTPVINPPQTAILGVGTTVSRVREQNGALTTYPAMTLSLTVDHRAVDGAPGARFLKALCDNLQAFRVLLAK